MDEREEIKKEKEKINALEVMMMKEELLAQLIVWLKAKNLYEDAAKDIMMLPKLKTKKNVIFFNVDTQKDFINPDGALYIKDAELIKQQLKFLTDYAAEHNIKVVNTADWHTDTDSEISDNPDFKTTFPKHCMSATEGSDFIEETYPKEFYDGYYTIHYTDSDISKNAFNRARNIIILKDAFDVFIGNRLTESALSLLHPDIVVVYGVSGDFCVDYVIKGLRKRNYNVVVVLDAVKSINETPTDEWGNLGVKLIVTSLISTVLLNEKL
jgi:nicotinamidase/pyrazinamidase